MAVLTGAQAAVQRDIGALKMNMAYILQPLRLPRLPFAVVDRQFFITTDEESHIRQAFPAVLTVHTHAGSAGTSICMRCGW